MSKIGRRLWLVRHGYRQDYIDPMWPQTALYPFDPPLSEQGLAQAQDLISAFISTRPDAVFVSPYLRTLQTIKPMASAYNLWVNIEDGLGEIYASQASFAPLSLSPTQRKKLVPQIDLDYRPVMSPGELETPQEAMTRAGNTVDELLLRFDGDFVLITHESPIKGILKRLAPNSAPVRCSFCGVTELQFNAEGWQLIRNGDVRHLTFPTATKRFLYDFARRQIARLIMAM